MGSDWPDYKTTAGSAFVGYFGSDRSAEMSPHHEVHAHRLLAGGGCDQSYFLDYSMVSFVILTSFLVLAVEAARHKLDSIASGNPFFYTVLNTMYHEITTLGIVEMALYLMHKYWEQFNYHVEATFVDVHFTLFYTALFNALQGCLIRIIAGWRTDSWTQTEDIDVGHYVAIRKEYDRVDRKLKAIDGEFGNVIKSDESYLGRLRAACKLAKNRIRHPRLSRRRNELLVPIRYHELRTHFLETNDLPSSFKVSHYLKRSLTSVLLDFVHINAAAWIALMATANMIYYFAGVLIAKTRNEKSAGWFLAGCFVVMVVGYIILSVVMSMKMEKIYSQTLRMKLSAQSGEEGTESFTALASRAKSVDQLSLFWFKSPRLIISIFQYIQFGYAFSISFIFIYFKEFKAQDFPVSPWFLLFLLIMSYLIVLYFMSIMIPRFTLCTSLGQLVNKARLNETKAKVKLNAEVRRLEALEEEKRAEEKISRRKRELEARQNAEKAKAEQKAAAFEKTRIAMGFPARSSDALESCGSSRHSHNGKKSPSDRVKIMTDMLRPSSPPTNWGGQLSFAASSQLEEGEDNKIVKFDAGKSLSPKDERKMKRRAQSEGVAQMRLSMKYAQETSGVGRSGAFSKQPNPLEPGRPESSSATERKERRRRRKALSDGVALMRLNAETTLGRKPPLDAVGEDKPTANITMISEFSRMSASDLPEIPPYKPKVAFLEKAAQVLAPMLSPVTSEDKEVDGDRTVKPADADMTMLPEIPSNQRRMSRRIRAKYDKRRAKSEGVAQMRLSMIDAQGSSRDDLCVVGVKRPDAQSATRSELSQLSSQVHSNQTKSNSSDDLSRKHVTESGRQKSTPAAERRERRPRRASMSEGVGLMRLNVEKTKGVDCLKRPDAQSVTRSEPLQPSSQHLPESGRRKATSAAERKERRPRRASMSEGVGLMRLNAETTLGRKSPLDVVSGDKPAETNITMISDLARMSVSDLPEIPPYKMRNFTRCRAKSDAQSATRSEPSQLSSQHLPESVRRKSTSDTEQRLRRPRRASMSEGVGLMRLNVDTTQAVVGLKRPDAQSVTRTEPSELSSQHDAVLSMRLSSKANPLLSPTLDTATSLDEPQSPAPRTARVTFSEKASHNAHEADQDFAMLSPVISEEISDDEGEAPKTARVTFSEKASHNAHEADQDFAMLSPVLSEEMSDDEDDDDISVGYWDGEIFDAMQVKDPWLWRLNDSLATFFLGRTYKMLSLLFGPITCFFVVAMRVEAFNHASCLLDDVPNTVHLPLNWSFWIEVAWYCAMMAEMAVVISTFRTRWHEGFEYSIIAATFGILINAMCLLLLVFSEVDRCCTAYGGDDESRRFLAAEYDSGGYDYKCTDATKACSCSDFGARTYGGLGWIEPFTALIALSPLRFFFAEYIISLFSISGREDLRALNKRHVSHHIHGLGAEEIHKMREYWMVCIGQNSFVAKSQGLFSGEMLLCMLGLYSDRSHLAAATDHEGGNTSLSKSSVPGSSNVVEANLFVSQAVTDNLETDHRFQYPTARLIRKMRRCESIMLPLVKKWIACDIALTNHELVLLEIEVAEDSPTSHTDTLFGGSGGKGLYLHEVAKGRKVLSLFSLDEIDYISIEHRRKINTTDLLFDPEQNDQTCREYWQGSTMTTESYDMSSMDARWSHVDEDRLKIRFQNYTLSLRFFADLGQKESEAKHEAPTTGFLNDIGTLSKRWCKTIARLRGKANLNQDLPNFGAGDEEELADYIEHCDRSDIGKKPGLRHHHWHSFHHLGPSSFGLETWRKREHDDEAETDSANDEHSDRGNMGKSQRSLRHHRWHSFHHRSSSSFGLETRRKKEHNEEAETDSANEEQCGGRNTGNSQRSLRHLRWHSFHRRSSSSDGLETRRKKERDEEEEMMVSWHK